MGTAAGSEQAQLKWAELSGECCWRCREKAAGLGRGQHAVSLVLLGAPVIMPGWQAQAQVWQGSHEMKPSERASRTGCRCRPTTQPRACCEQHEAALRMHGRRPASSGNQAWVDPKLSSTLTLPCLCTNRMLERWQTEFHSAGPGGALAASIGTICSTTLGDCPKPHPAPQVSCLAWTEKQHRGLTSSSAAGASQVMQAFPDARHSRAVQAPPSHKQHSALTCFDRCRILTHRPVSQA